MSAESGISTFRDAGGLWDKYPVEQVATPEGYAANPHLVIDFYNERRKQLIDVKPNRGHELVAELEKHFQVTVITQNVDGLHQRAGSENVIELHGTILKHYCPTCKTVMPNEQVKALGGQIPRCEKCHHIVRPDVVLYEEPLNERVIESAIDAISSADLLIIGGTSLAVYPAANFLRYFADENIVLINRDETQIDSRATLVFRESIGEVLSETIKSL